MELNMNKLNKYTQMKRRTRPEFINIHPIQAAGKLTAAAKKALIEFGDGYSVCDLCLEGKIQTIKNPPIKDFLEDIATFMGMEVARPTAGSRIFKPLILSITIFLSESSRVSTWL